MHEYKAIAESNNFIVLDKYTKEWADIDSYQSESELEQELIQDSEEAMQEEDSLDTQEELQEAEEATEEL